MREQTDGAEATKELMKTRTTRFVLVCICKNEVEMMVTVNAIKACTPSHDWDEGICLEA